MLFLFSPTKKQKKFQTCGDDNKVLSREELLDYEEYLAELTEEELKIELQWLESIGQAKKRGSTIVQNDSYYDM